MAAPSMSPAQASSGLTREEPIENCRGAKTRQVACNGKARVECTKGGRGKILESCPEACADGVCTCAYGPEPTCPAQPTAPCTEQGPNVPIIDIARGGNHTCALMQGGCVRCWSGPLQSTGQERNALADFEVFKSDKGMLGIPGRDLVTQTALWDAAANVRLGGKAIAISAGEGHTCVILEGGCVRCWGANDRGQLGLGNTANVGYNESPNVVSAVRLGGQVKALSLGSDFSCALLVGGSIRCWGRNDCGQLGLGHMEDLGKQQGPLAACPVNVGDKAKMLSVGPAYACVLMESQKIRCWGKGPLGLPNRAFQEEPNGDMLPKCNTNRICVGDNEAPVALPPVELPARAISVSAGSSHVCAQLDDYTVQCWGDNDHYQLGFELPEETNAPTPLPTKFPRAVVNGIFTGFWATCALGESGAVYCAGSGSGRFDFEQNCCGRAPTIYNGGLFPGIRQVPHIFEIQASLSGAFSGSTLCAHFGLEGTLLGRSVDAV